MKTPGLVSLLTGGMVAVCDCDKCDAGGPVCVDNCIESCDCYDSGEGDESGDDDSE